MTTKQEWLALAERCEKAAGPDRQLDASLFDALSAYEDERAGRSVVTGSDPSWLPRCTASIDAITAIIEREFPSVVWRSNRIAQYFINFGNPRYCGQIRYRHQRKDHEWTEYVEALQDTPALALCAAFCRAMAGKAGT